MNCPMCDGKVELDDGTDIQFFCPCCGYVEMN